VTTITRLYVNDVSIEDYVGAGDFIVNNIDGRGPVSRSAETIDVPSMDGAHFRRVKTNIRTLKVAFTLKADNLPDLRYRVDLLNGLINYDGPVPIRFSDEPTKTYYGVAVGDASFDEIRSFGQGTLTFECYDPFKYGEEEYKAVYGGYVAVVNEGNVHTKPRFEVRANRDITHLDFILEETGEYMRLGSPSSVDTEVYEPRELVFTDDCSSTIGWATGSAVDNGHVAGNMTSDGDGFYPETFGGVMTPTAWQGPAIKRGIGESLQDFHLSVTVDHINTADETGMIEVYMLDIDNNVVAKVGIEDRWESVAKMVGKFQLGEDGINRYNYSREPAKPTAWNDYYGVLEITRDSRGGTNLIYPYFALVNKQTGMHEWVSSAFVYTDYEGLYQAEVTQVQIATRKWPLTEPTEMKIKEVSVWKLNPAPTESSVPVLARAGERLVIDHASQEITVNGKSVKAMKEFGANFFNIPPGVSEIVQRPADVGSTNVYWRSKYR
jgi:predicted phage tail component-like protein